MAKENLSFQFGDDFTERVSACSCCWYFNGDIEILGSLAYDCQCSADCGLVWCSKPRSDASKFSCSELRYLHETNGIDIEAIFSGDAEIMNQARSENAKQREIDKIQLPMDLEVEV